MSVITICAKKGGTGKTTTAINFAAGLAALKKRVLVIDMDSQCNLSAGLGIYNPDLVSIKHVLTSKCQLSQAVQSNGNLDIVQSSLNLHEIESLLSANLNLLDNAIKTLNIDYDFIIIDTPPAIGSLTQSSLAASDDVIIVSQADKFSLDGLYQLDSELKNIKNRLNLKLSIDGILITRFSPRASMRCMIRDVMIQAAKSLGTKVYNTSIRENVALPESQVRKMSIFKHNRRSNGAADYFSFIKEFLNEHDETVSIDVDKIAFDV